MKTIGLGQSRWVFEYCSINFRFLDDISSFCEVESNEITIFNYSQDFSMRWCYSAFGNFNFQNFQTEIF